MCATSAPHISEKGLGTHASNVYNLFCRRKQIKRREVGADLESQLCAVKPSVDILRVADRRGSAERGQSRPAVYTARANANRCIKLVPVHLLRTNGVRLAEKMRRRIGSGRGENTTAAA